MTDLENQIGVHLTRTVADAGHKGHNAPEHFKLKVFTSGQKRELTPAIKRDLKRRAAVEPVIGRLKSEHRMGRNSLAPRSGDAINALLAAAGDNVSLLVKWPKLWRAQMMLEILAIIPWAAPSPGAARA